MAAVAGKIDALPAGGEFVGVLVFIFVLLLITDILGFTKVYSFARPVRKVNLPPLMACAGFTPALKMRAFFIVYFGFAGARKQ